MAQDLKINDLTKDNVQDSKQSKHFVEEGAKKKMPQLSKSPIKQNLYLGKEEETGEETGEFFQKLEKICRIFSKLVWRIFSTHPREIFCKKTLNSPKDQLTH